MSTSPPIECVQFARESGCRPGRAGRGIVLAVMLAAALAARNDAQAAPSTIGGTLNKPQTVDAAHSPATILSGTTITVSDTSAALRVTGSGVSATALGPVTLTNNNSGTGRGAIANFGGTLTMNGGTITSLGADGVLIGGASPSVAAFGNFTNVNIMSVGVGLDGTRVGTIVNYIGGAITTTAKAAHGVYSDSGAQVNLSNTAINTEGQQSFGVWANTINLAPPAFQPPNIGLFGATIAISGGSIKTAGLNAIGVLSTGPDSKLTLEGAKISTDAAIAVEAAPPPPPPGFFTAPTPTGGIVIMDNTIAKAGGMFSGALVQDGGQLTIQNKSSLEGTSGGVTLTNSAGNTLVDTVVVDHSTITADAGDAFRLQGAVGATITVSNVNNTIRAGSGNLFNAVGSTATLTAINSTLTGSVLSADSTVDLNILDNSVLIVPGGGTVSATHTLLPT